MNHTVTFTIYGHGPLMLLQGLAAIVLLLLVMKLPTDLAVCAVVRVYGRFGFDRKSRRVVRRWFGPRSRVRALPGSRRHGLAFDIYTVDAWEQHGGDFISIWVRVVPAHLPHNDSWWVPLGTLAPYQVPALRPHLERGRPRLTRYVPAVTA